jgi:hypothetical protein
MYYFALYTIDNREDSPPKHFETGIAASNSATNHPSPTPFNALCGGLSAQQTSWSISQMYDAEECRPKKKPPQRERKIKTWRLGGSNP